MHEKRLRCATRMREMREKKMRTPEHYKKEEAAAKKEEAARENAEARKAQSVVQDLAELASREAKAAAEAAKNAVAQRARDAVEAVGCDVSEVRVRNNMLHEAEVAVVAAAEMEAKRRKVAALAEKADGLLKAGHAANKQGDYAKAPSPATPLPNRSPLHPYPVPTPPPPLPSFGWPLARACLAPPASPSHTPQPHTPARVRAGAPFLPGGARASAQARGARLGGQHGAQARRGLYCQAGV